MHSLASYHTFGLPASCSDLMTIDELDDLMQNIDKLKNSDFLFLGEGSNTIFINDYDGLIVLNRLKGIHVGEDDEFYHLNVASGENWHNFVEYCLKHKMYGMENLALIPGTVGAAPIQNIGAYGIEVKSFIHSVEFVDLDTKMMGYFNNKECEFAYRDSVFKQDKPGKRLITAVNFVIPKDYKAELSYSPLSDLAQPSAKDVFDTVIKTRQQKLPDPKDLGNAGSFFKNPIVGMPHFLKIQESHPDVPHYAIDDTKVKIPAAWLIDQLGFKGKAVGDVSCHQNQALVLVNNGNGTGADVVKLAAQIKAEVEDAFAISLVNEVQLIGQDGPIQL